MVIERIPSSIPSISEEERETLLARARKQIEDTEKFEQESQVSHDNAMLKLTTGMTDAQKKQSEQEFDERRKALLKERNRSY